MEFNCLFWVSANKNNYWELFCFPKRTHKNWAWIAGWTPPSHPLSFCYTYKCIALYFFLVFGLNQCLLFYAGNRNRAADAYVLCLLHRSLPPPRFLARAGPSQNAHNRPTNAFSLASNRSGRAILFLQRNHGRSVSVLVMFFSFFPSTSLADSIVDQIISERFFRPKNVILNCLQL